MDTKIIKIVNGLQIIHYVGSVGYFVSIPDADRVGFVGFHSFSTMKAAKEFCSSVKQEVSK